MAKRNKTNKSITKRIKVTKNDKLRHRACGQDHFNSRDAAKKRTNKKKDKTMSNANSKTIRQAIGK